MLKKNLFYNSLLSVTQFIFPLITFPYSSRILGPGGIGSVNFIDSITAYFVLFAFLGIPAYGVREVAKRRNDQATLEKFVSEILVIHGSSVILSSVIYLVASLISPTLRVHMDLVLVGVWLLFMTVISVDWFFEGIEKFKYISIRSLIARTLSVIFLFVFLRKGSSSLVYYLIGASGPTINSITNFIMFRKNCKVRFTNLDLKQHIKPLITILGSSLAVSVYVLLDSIVLGFIKGDVEVGLYSTATRIVRIPFAIIGAIGVVVIPQVSYAYSKGDKAFINSLIHKSFSFIVVVGMPIAIGMFLEAGFLINTFAGEAFKSAIFILQLLSPVVLLVGLTNIFAVQLLTPIGQEKLLLRAVFLGMTVSIVLNFCLIPIFSYTGAAITFLITEAVVPLACYFYVRKFVSISFDYKILLQSLFGSLLFIPIALLIRRLDFNDLYKEILIIVTCILLYSSYVWFFVKNIYISNIKADVIEKVRSIFGIRLQKG